MRIPFLLVFLLTNGVAFGAGCESSDPEAFSREFFHRHRAFYYTETTGLRRYVAPSLYGLLVRHYRCQSDGESCHLDYDPWLGAQDGEMVEPVSFVAQSPSGGTISVRMRYGFESGGGSPTVPREVVLQLEKSTSPLCWRLSDLITPLGDSLAKRYRGTP